MTFGTLYEADTKIKKLNDNKWDLNIGYQNHTKYQVKYIIK